jgi:Mitochondrial export protein Som1
MHLPKQPLSEACGGHPSRPGMLWSISLSSGVTVVGRNHTGCKSQSGNEKLRLMSWRFDGAEITSKLPPALTQGIHTKLRPRLQTRTNQLNIRNKVNRSVSRYSLNRSKIAMAPLVPIFPASELPEQVQIVSNGFKEKRRKGPPIDLEKCELLELMQHSCNPPSEGVPPPGVVKCKPILRLFRRYKYLTSMLLLYFLFLAFIDS